MASTLERASGLSDADFSLMQSLAATHQWSDIRVAASADGKQESNRPFVVSHVERRKVDGLVELSALVDGFRLWFRFPFVADELRAEPLIAATLLPAMATGRTLRFAEPLLVSERFLNGVSTIQSILHAWNPRLKQISIEAGATSAARGSVGVGAFYSGGVDGSFTLLRRVDEIQYLVILNGFDFQSDAQTFAEAVARNRRFCQSIGKELLPCETNCYEFGTRYRVSRLASYGGLLASVALSLGFRRTYIASSLGYLDMPAQGSHPLLDHLWGTETNEIIHDGAETSRPSKLAYVAQCRAALDNLRVCLNQPNNNCGGCAKCVRTMINLRVLGHDESKVFPGKLTMADVDRFPVDSYFDRCFAADNLQLAIRRRDQSIVKILRKQIWKYDLRRLVIDFDREMLNGAMKKFKRRLRRAAADDETDIWPSAGGH